MKYTQPVTAEDLIKWEMELQDQMWGAGTDNIEAINDGQFQRAAMGQLTALFEKENGDPDAFSSPPPIFPEDWDPGTFRDYGTGIANLVVAAAWLTQEIRRRLNNGESRKRSPRDPVRQPYVRVQPNKVYENL
jgi:hypothetical protein